jgi:hypothetical protein
MKFKLLMRRLFGVSAARMTIRRHVPWPLRLASTALAIAVGAVGAFWLWQYLFGQVSATQQSQRVEIARLRTELERVDSEKQKLDGFVNSASSQIKVEKTAADRLAGQIKSLEEENAQLKADIAYFESLLPAGSSTDSGVSIRRFEVSTDTTTNQIRYRALLMQGGRQEKEFSGNVQLVVSTMSAGRPGVWTWPEQAAGDARERGKLNFKRYQRLEGSLELPVGTTARSVQLRILEKGAVRVQQSVNL